LRLHAGPERVPVRADLPGQERRAHGADRRDHRADPRRRLLLGPAHGGGAARLGPGRGHLLVLRGVLRGRPDRRLREGIVATPPGTGERRGRRGARESLWGIIPGPEVLPVQSLGFPTRRLAVLALLSSMTLTATGAAEQTPAPAPASAPAAKTGLPPVGTVSKTWTGDFDGMVKRRVIRVLVPYSKTFYFVDRAIQRGLSYEVTQLLEADLNKKLKTGNIRLHVICIPVARGEMIPYLLEGRGDIAMGNLTITPERQKKVDFTYPTGRNVKEIVVSGPGAEPIATAEDLAGKEVYVRKSSSYHESIEKLNEELGKARKAKVKIRLAPENLEDEDILEMVNAGLVKATIVEDYIADFWKKIFPKLIPNSGATVRTGGEIAWMIRKDSPQLRAELDPFLQRFEKSGQRSDILARYLKNTKWPKAATSKEDIERY